MKTEDLQAIGLTEEQIKKVFELNGKDVKAEKLKAEKIEADRDQWKERAETAEETLKGFDGVDVDKLNREIADWKEKAENAEKDYKQKMHDRDIADALAAAFADVKFTSEAAKRAILTEARNEEWSFLDNGQLKGFTEWLDQVRGKDASAFETNKPTVRFTDTPKSVGTPTGTKSLKDYTLDERIKLKSSNPELYEKLRKGE